MSTKWTVPVLLLLGFAKPATAQQAFVTQVFNQLQANYVESDVSFRSYVIGKLDDDATDTWTFGLTASTAYVIAAVCDNDCSDIDVQVFDPAGQLVVQDSGADDHPVVRFVTKQEGVYKILVRMYVCRSNPCFFGVGIFYAR